MSEYEKQLEDAVEKLQALIFKLISDDKSNLVYMFKPKNESYKFVFNINNNDPYIFKSLKECAIFLCLKSNFVINELQDSTDNVVVTHDSNFINVFKRLGMKWNIFSFNLDTFEETLVFPPPHIKMDTL